MTGRCGKLPQTVCDDRAFDRLPLLADALGQVGGADLSLVGRLRGLEPHVRACWAVNLLLKELTRGVETRRPVGRGRTHGAFQSGTACAAGPAPYGP